MDRKNKNWAGFSWKSLRPAMPAKATENSLPIGRFVHQLGDFWRAPRMKQKRNGDSCREAKFLVCFFFVLKQTRISIVEIAYDTRQTWSRVFKINKKRKAEEEAS